MQEAFEFISDLEFIQCLANPNYLEYLHKVGYYKDENFIKYLNHLLYFVDNTEYRKYITYSRCLIFLKLLQYEFFRNELGNPGFVKYLYDMSYSDWAGTLEEFKE